MYNNQVYDEIDILIDYYMKNKIDVTVEDVCNHCISRDLNRNITMDIMSYFYGFNEELVINSNNNIIRQMGIISMKKFDKAINLIDYNYNIQLYLLANRNIERSSLESYNNTQGGSHITNNQPNDNFNTNVRLINNEPSTPPPLMRNIRSSQNTVSEIQQIEIDRYIPTVRRLRFGSDIIDDDIQEYIDDCVVITSIQDYVQNE